MNRKGKKFQFPRNVTKDYGVIGDITLRHLLTVILPAVLVGLTIIVLPPHGLIPIFIKLILFCSMITAVVAVTTLHPIKERPNITVRDYFLIRKKYKKMQKLYFLEPKKRRDIDEKTN